MNKMFNFHPLTLIPILAVGIFINGDNHLVPNQTDAVINEVQSQINSSSEFINATISNPGVTKLLSPGEITRVAQDYCKNLSDLKEQYPGQATVTLENSVTDAFKDNPPRNSISTKDWNTTINVFSTNIHTYGCN